MNDLTIKEENLRGKYVAYFDKDSKYRVGKVNKVGRQYLSIVDWECIIRRIDKSRVLYQITPTLQRQIIWKQPKKRGK